jgi:hypothetical protein
LLPLIAVMTGKLAPFAPAILNPVDVILSRTLKQNEGGGRSTSYSLVDNSVA